jgi:hypothetical protein
MPRQDIGRSVGSYYPYVGSTSSIGMSLHAPRQCTLRDLQEVIPIGR